MFIFNIPRTVQFDPECANGLPFDPSYRPTALRDPITVDCFIVYKALSVSDLSATLAIRVT